MTVAKHNTAKGLRRSDNGPRAYILTNSGNPLPFQFPETVQDEGYVYNTVPIGVISPSLVKYARVHKPLRKIIARTPESFEKAPGYILTYYIDTLECGHQVITYSGEESKKKRGCQDCLDALIAAKKPVRSAA